MRILILNQAFYPDVVSTAQHAADLACKLQEQGHQVTVVASRYGYDDNGRVFARHENWKGISIRRISMLRLGKSSKWRRACGFLSFLVNCFAVTALLPKFDAVITMTSPPLISVLAATLVRWKGGKLVSWVMDLNPDEAIAAGWLREDSTSGRVLQKLLRFTLHQSERLVALDTFMADRLRAKGVPGHRIAVIPPWSHDRFVRYDTAGRTDFRREHALQGKFVVMYSGNHSPCHPLDTLLDAARRLRHRADIAFCFVGGGSEFRKIQQSAQTEELRNITCIPYQPIEKLSSSLSAADLHVVAMGDPFVGIVHPCKVYNIRTLGVPFLYIGPAPSHITELGPAGQFRHGDVEGVQNFILAASASQSASHPIPAADASAHGEEVLVQELADLVASVSAHEGQAAARTPALPQSRSAGATGR